MRKYLRHAPFRKKGKPPSSPQKCFCLSEQDAVSRSLNVFMRVCVYECTRVVCVCVRESVCVLFVCVRMCFVRFLRTFMVSNEQNYGISRIDEKSESQEMEEIIAVVFMCVYVSVCGGRNQINLKKLKAPLESGVT